MWSCGLMRLTCGHVVPHFRVHVDYYMTVVAVHSFIAVDGEHKLTT